jgi:hypothetical protein
LRAKIEELNKSCFLIFLVKKINLKPDALAGPGWVGGVRNPDFQFLWHNVETPYFEGRKIGKWVSRCGSAEQLRLNKPKPKDPWCDPAMQGDQTGQFFAYWACTLASYLKNTKLEPKFLGYLFYNFGYTLI